MHLSGIFQNGNRATAFVHARKPLGSLVMLIILAGCTNDEGVMHSELLKFAFRMSLTGHELELQPVVKAGENITFSISLINASVKPITWTFNNECQLGQNDDFLNTYRETSDMQYEQIGKAYQIPPFCLAIKMPPRYLPPGETIVKIVSWDSNSDNPALTPGHYRSTAHIQLIDHEYTRSWILNTEFEVK